MPKITKELKELVIARIEAYPKNFGISIGMDKDYSKNELIKNVEKETTVGKQIVEIEWEFLQDMIKGNIYNSLDKNA